MLTLTISELKNNVFSGSDSYGRNYEVAVKDNNIYHRNYGFNGYGMAWGKWEKLNSFSGEFYLNECDNYGNKEMLHWGFGCDAVGYINNRIRLPK